VSKALLLPDSAPELAEACLRGGLEIALARDLTEGRALAAAGGFALVDARLARPRPLEEEIRHRLETFFARLADHRPGDLYDAVMREVERPLIAGALARARGVRAVAALALGIDRGTLARRIRALGLDEPRA
jgi:Fis family transcriptional regulator, factor for inversion stimulation protein